MKAEHLSFRLIKKIFRLSHFSKEKIIEKIFACTCTREVFSIVSALILAKVRSS